VTHTCLCCQELSGCIAVYFFGFPFSFFSVSFKFVFSLIYCNIIALAFIGGGGVQNRWFGAWEISRGLVGGAIEA